MSSQEDSERFVDTLTSPSNSVSIATLPGEGITDNRNLKKRKFEDTPPIKISENNITKFKVLKKLNIQLTRTDHHISYLQRCEQSKTIPKSLRVNLTQQVPVINSYLQLRWEEAQLNFGLTLTKILLEYWENRRKSIQEEIKVISDIIKENTEQDEIDFTTTIIDRISITIEKDLSSKKTTTTTSNRT